MADPHGFLNIRTRATAERRPVPVRLMDWKEVYEDRQRGVVREQAGRCMDCGIPFCHAGCPLGNIIPEWNDLTWRGNEHEAMERLHATNNFPEFTGLLCPAPCESACVLGINQPAVTIKEVEAYLVQQAWDTGDVAPQAPDRLTGKTVAVVGSGPAGLAAAQQLTRVGHTVVVYERDDRIGGLLRYGIPDFKMEKRHLERRLAQMRSEGTRFRPSVNIGEDITWDELRQRYDAVVVTTGATLPRHLDLPGRELDGVHYAMEYLTQANRVQAGDEVDGQISAAGKHVIVIGGGDTGSDCVGTALRQGAASVTTLAIGVKPPVARPASQPWPTVPRVFEVSTSNEEGGERRFLASTVAYVGDEQGRLTGLSVARTDITPEGRIPAAGTEETIEADLVLVAMGFTGPEKDTLDDQLGLAPGSRTVDRDADYMTSRPGVFVAGDAGRGQSLVVWAIAEGRAAAASVDRWLMGTTRLPSPVAPTDRPLHV